MIELVYEVFGVFGSSAMSWLPIVAVAGLNHRPSTRNATVVLGSEMSGNRAAIIFVGIFSWAAMYSSIVMSGW